MTDPTKCPLCQVRTPPPDRSVCERCVPANPARERIAALEADVRRLTDERDKLQAFKDWVHAYLDAQGVPHHPPGSHGAEGCRIGDRMDWLMDLYRRSLETGDRLAARVAELEQRQP